MAESALMNRERRIQDFAETASDWFWEMDENLRFSYMSPNVRRVLGVAPESLLGKTREDSLGENCDRQAWDTHLRTLRAHLPFHGFTFAWKGERWVRISGTPIFNADGSFAGYRGMGSDISEIKKAEQAFRESERRFRDFAESSADWFWEMDENLRFTWMSPNVEQIVGVPPEWHYGKTRQDLLGDNYDADLWDAHFQVLNERKAFRDFVFLRQGDGIPQKWIQTSGKPIFDMENRFLGYRGTGSDITRARETEEQLLQAQKMETVGQLTGGIAHDFNNLLGIVIGNLDFLAESAGIDDDQQTLIATALQSALRGADLTHRLLAFSRGQTLKPESKDLGDLIAGITGLLERTLGEAIAINVVAGTNLKMTYIDPSQFESALLNLAVNSLHAMPDGGKLTIETANVDIDSGYAHSHLDVSPGSYVMLAVSDTGCGMPRAVREQVFEPFFTTKPVGKGSGLGLSMVHGFVKQSGGHVRIYSEPDKGTTIRLYFPVSVREALPVVAKTEYEPESRGQGETVLVVEDDDGLRDMAVTVIRKLGYRVVEARDGLAALSLIDHDDTIDLLFTDVVLPRGMNGHELAQESLRRRPNLKVLYTSGYTDNAILNNGLLDSGFELVSKPYMRAELAIRLRQALLRKAGVQDSGSTMDA